jgi:hypothetical protein
MKNYFIAAGAAAFLASASASSAQSAAPVAGIASAEGARLTCEQIGVELTDLTGTTMNVALTAAERANRKRHNPTSVANAVTNQALGMVAGAGGSDAVGALGNALGMIQQVQTEKENRQAAIDQRAFSEMGSASNLANLERVGMLHELWMSKNCEGAN